MSTEIRVIPSHPEYSASTEGQIWSEKSGRFLRDYKGKFGSRRVNLSEAGVRSGSVGVHRLVCEAFHGPAPQEKPWALHRNGKAWDNRPENLYWGDAQDNVDDMLRHGTQVSQAETHCAKNHPYDPENTYRYPDGGRGCRECHRVSARRMSQGGLLEGDPRHGTNTGYANSGCRCGLCLTARREYINARSKS